MDHDKSRSRDRKDLYIAPLIIALVIAVLVGVIMLRQPVPEPTKVVEPAPPPALPAKPAVRVVSTAPLQRVDLLAAVQRAASDYAGGNHTPSSPDALKGRRFSLRLPFACNGANGVMLNPQATVSYDVARASLTLTAQPGLWTTLPVMQPLLEAGKA